MQGDYELKTQIDSSHRFLYGHRFWKETKAAIIKHAESFASETGDLANEIRAIAKNAATAARMTEDLTVGITAVGLMTLVQVGLDAFKQSAGTISVDEKTKNQSPQKVVEQRAKDDSQGILGFLKTINKEWTVNYIDDTDNGKFRLMDDEEIASGAARDQTKKLGGKRHPARRRRDSGRVSFRRLWNLLGRRFRRRGKTFRRFAA